VLLTYAVAAFGVVMLFSTTHLDHPVFYIKQIVWIVIGSVGLCATTLIDYHVYIRFSRQIYTVNLVLLALVLKFAAVNGAARWIRVAGFEFQPSESAKLLVILALGAFLVRHHESIQDPRTLFQSLGYVLVPALLIFKQPDLGTALVILSIWFSMVFMAGAKVQHLALLLVVGSLLFAGLWHSGKVISNYQKNRLLNYVHPETNTASTGYHVYRARIAIGSGGVWGKGLLKSTQVQGGYIPEKQTDFIFTDVGEELGFVGSVALTLLYGCLLLRGYVVVASAEDDLYGKLISTGIVTMIAFHVIVNIGMNIGILPVAGVPLPLVSSGGSNVLVTLASIGLLESVAVHRHRMLF
jgi:rod shape determining protein RodA